MESNHCLNCSQIIAENYCSNCGQKKNKRIDKKYITDEIQYTILHTNKGFLYSIKKIVQNPGKTARAFIDGNRVNHYKPILLAFVLCGISAFISYKIIGLNEIMSTYYGEQQMRSKFMNDYMTFTASYNSIIMLFLVPFFAVFTKLAFRKWGHNYYEHIVMNAFILSFYIVLNVVLLYPAMYFFKNNADLVIRLVSISTLTWPFILTWFFKEFYDTKSLKSIIGRVLITLLLVGVAFFLLVTLSVVGVMLYKMINEPEAVEYLKTK